jgi:hypothetical protein
MHWNYSRKMLITLSFVFKKITIYKKPKIHGRSTTEYFRSGQSSYDRHHSPTAYLHDKCGLRRQLCTGAHKVTGRYRVAMQKFPQPPKGFYSMDIIIVGVYNKEEGKVSENSFHCSLTTILAMRLGR